MDFHKFLGDRKILFLLCANISVSWWHSSKKFSLYMMLSWFYKPFFGFSVVGYLLWIADFLVGYIVFIVSIMGVYMSDFSAATNSIMCLHVLSLFWLKFKFVLIFSSGYASIPLLLAGVA
jgi:hypothetical protein